MSVEIRRSSDRFVEREPGRLTRHAFSFGPVLDPERMAFGPMVCHDDHLLGPGQGFDEHPHAGLEIVTWVVSGAVAHRDATGAGLGDETVLAAGDCGVLTAGAGVRHAEHATAGGPARFVQVWLSADPEAEPRHRRASVTAEPGDGLVPVIGTDGPLAVGVSGATFAVARLAAHETLRLPAAPKVHAFITTGALLRFSLAEPLAAGDAVAMIDQPGHEVTAAVPTEMLVWAFA